MLAASGVAPAVYVPVAAVPLAIAGLSTVEALWKRRFERTYGDFFMASAAVASQDVIADDGRVLARRGIDEMCELHVIGGLGRMKVLSRQGRAGRLTIVAETLEGLQALAEDMDDPLFAKARVVTARSDLVGLLFKMGFEEVSAPRPYDVANRLEKRLLMLRLGRLVGRDRSTRPEDYRMAVMTRERFTGDEFRAAIARQVERARADLERASAEVTPAGAPV